MRSLVLVAFVAAVSPARADSSAPTTARPLVLTGAKLKEYFELYRDPFVRDVRKELDRYLRGQLEAESPAVKGLESDGSDGLNAFSKDYYKGRFIVIQVAPFLGGGRTVSIVFCDKPDKMFDVWIYKLGAGEYEMRAFQQDKSFAPAEIEFVYRNLLRDRKHSL